MSVCLACLVVDSVVFVLSSGGWVRMELELTTLLTRTCRVSI